jgi:hypothetical protein
VYKDYDSYAAGLSPVFYNVLPQLAEGSMDFTTWFTIDVMSQAGHDLLTQSMGYLIEQFPPAK